MDLFSVKRQATARRSPSLRLRLTLWTVAVAAVIQLVLGTIALFYQRRSIDQVFSRRVEARGAMLGEALAQLEVPPTDDTLRDLARRFVAPVLRDQYAVAMYSGDGRVLALTEEVPDLADIRRREQRRAYVPAQRLKIPRFSFSGDEDATVRVALRPVSAAWGDRPFFLIVTSDQYFEERVGGLSRLALVIVPIGLAGTGIAAWVISGLVMVPLRQARRLASTLAPENIRHEVTVPVRPDAELAAFQRDLVDVRAKLRQSFLAQDRLIAHLSHELKTPIAVLLVEANALTRAELPHEAREFVHSVQDEMRRLSKMLQSTMIVSRAQAGQSVVSAQPCDLADLVGDAIHAASQLAASRRIELDLRVPSTDQRCVVYGDPDMLRLLVEHLLRGAIAASPRGERVEVTVEATADVSAVSVRDAGEAVPEAAIAAIFDWFTSGPHECSARRSPDLAIAKAIAELHEGTITVRNADGSGCVFRAELPRSNAATVRLAS